MASNSLLQIVSGFKPDVDGMGDFAKILGQGLSDQKSIRSHFAVYRCPNQPLGLEEIAPNSISYPDQTSLRAFQNHLEGLLEAHEFKSVILHYGPYAYAHDGKPAAFGKMIQSLAKKTELLVFFHETYAKGFPWKRAFWTYTQQRETVRQILNSSKIAFASTSLVMRRLEKLNSNRIKLDKIRIFSNIGEPANLKPLSLRSRQLVIFGRLVNRLQLYNDHMAALENICTVLDIETVVDVGVGTSPEIPNKIAHAPVTSLGRLSEENLSRLFADSLAGVVGYGPDHWEKSGVLASYEAHAMVPILIEWEKRRLPIESVIPYIPADAVSSLPSVSNVELATDLQRMADDAHSFYHSHQSVSRCVETIALSLKALWSAAP